MRSCRNSAIRIVGVLHHAGTASGQPVNSPFIALRSYRTVHDYPAGREGKRLPIYDRVFFGLSSHSRLTIKHDPALFRISFDTCYPHTTAADRPVTVQGVCTRTMIQRNQSAQVRTEVKKESGGGEEE